MNGGSGSKFSIHTYESPRNVTSYGEAAPFGVTCQISLDEREARTSSSESKPLVNGESQPLHANFGAKTSAANLQASGNASDVRSELQLSGRIISASVCIRHALGFDQSNNWSLSSRRGTSALFDHFTYLSSSDSPWSHTLVAWTGEIESTCKHTRADPRADASKQKTSVMTPGFGSAPFRTGGQRLSNAAKSVTLTSEDRKSLERRLWDDAAVRTVPVWLFDEADEEQDMITLTDQARWRRYAEHELYPLFHYRLNPPTDGSKERKWWADYVRMNTKFADRIMEIYQPGDIVWVHDYHLMLLPSILRQRNAKMYVGFFQHAPFPTSELFRCAKTRRELLRGVLGANLVAFQTYNYARHFSSCCMRILGFDASSSGVNAYGAHIAVVFLPIGVDAQLVEEHIFQDPKVSEAAARIRNQYKDLKIIVGRDRLDTGRGVSQKLQAYELFLQQYPQWQGKVVLIQLTNPTSIDEGKEDTESAVIKKISDQIADINDVYGDPEWTPILHYPRYLSKAEYYALLQSADLGLVTSVRDGMNTTAMEFIVAQRDNHSSLILSEFSGTAAKLEDATLVNPWDLAGVAEEINLALTLSKEAKVAQHKKLFDHVKTETVRSWSKVYLDTLMINLASFNKNLLTPHLDKVDLLLQYRKSRRRLFMFDYDGTLTPTSKEPDAAIPSDRVIRTIKKLAQDPFNNVWVISGRSQNFLNEWMGHIPELGLSAEHGSFIRKPHCEKWENLAAQYDLSWQQEVLGVVEDFAEQTQGSYVEKKENAITWHYRRADPELGKHQARECKKLLDKSVAKEYEIEILRGKASLEVRPRFVNKGEIAKRLIDSHRAGKDSCNPVSQAGPDFVLCIGDDLSDEDMFKAFNESGLPRRSVFSCTVGASTKLTVAHWHLLEPSDVIATISLLNGRPSASDAAAIETVEARLRDETNS